MGISFERWMYIMAQKPPVIAPEEEDDSDEWLPPDADLSVQVSSSSGDGPSDDDPATASPSPASAAAAVSASFFSHFDNPSSHVAYLHDQALVSAFEQAIALNEGLLKDKVVLDLGCGPGHLAMMCAKAGARRVYAVDGSEAACALARQVVAANGFASRITVLHSSAEALTLKEQVDVIVCDSIGPMLLGGGLMRALAIAKRNLLKPGGLVLPDEAELFVAGVDDRDYLVSAKQQWDKLAGFDMTPAMVQVAKTPRLDTLSRTSQLFTSTCRLLKLRMGPAPAAVPAPGSQTPPAQGPDADAQATAATPSEVGGSNPSASKPSQEGSGGAVPLSLRVACHDGFRSRFELQALRDERLFALMLWVQAAFTFSGQASDPVLFSAHPARPPTHQQQLLLNFPKSIRLAKGDTLTGTIAWRPSLENPRAVEVDVEVDYKGLKASASYTLPALMASLAGGRALH